MHRSSLLITLVGFVTCLTSLGATEVPHYYMDYFYVTPGFTNKLRNTKLLMKLGGNGTLTNKTIYIYMYNSKYKSGSRIAFVHPTDETGVVAREITGTMFVENEQNRIKAFWGDGDGTTKELWLYPKTNVELPRLKVHELGTHVYESPHVYGYTKERGSFITNDSYIFSNWYELNEMSVFNKFDISMFTFQEKVGPIPVGIGYEDLCIVFPAKYGLFVDLNAQEKDLQRVDMPLKFVDSGGYNYHLEFDVDLYVNPYTYEMARSQLPGFVKTKYMYLPKNGFHEFNKMDLIIVGYSLGTLKLGFEYYFSIEAELSRIGDCVTSEYCIKTADAQFSEMGKELSHD